MGFLLELTPGFSLHGWNDFWTKKRRGIHLKHKFNNRKEIYHGRIVNLTVDEITTANGHETIREVFHHPGGAAVVPVLPNGDILLVRQFRYPMQEYLLELPAGKIDSGEAPEVTAARELVEEVGFTAGFLRKIGEFYTTPGFCNEKIHLFLAKDLVASQKTPDFDEEIEVVRHPLGKLLELITEGRIIDAKTIIGIQYLSLNQG